jgi:hypothetical protein
MAFTCQVCLHDGESAGLLDMGLEFLYIASITGSNCGLPIVTPFKFQLTFQDILQKSFSLRHVW